ncbi:PD-(D/E)XK nuclease family protein [uncultured Bifidobacterium sp.]|uniref:PD-(D/E)XK nuclease family protein n=1 Tax=uncultured Bifidobacterium sp. TaxID=165187 RepID=UPI0028DC3FFF|nr:PD-(D/E)XK nuclease family protein [uncultured Bifidobacterium sp.]
MTNESERPDRRDDPCRTKPEQTGETSRFFQASASVDDLLGDRLRAPGGEISHALLVLGAPCAGKTRFALTTLERLVKGDEGPSLRSAPPALMVCSLRRIARDLNEEILSRIGSTTTPRLVTTLPALAFAVLARARSASGAMPPRLLNGAEQDALVEGVLDAHRNHARRGDSCDTCILLARYFAVSSASVADSVEGGGVTSADGPTATSPSAMAAQGTTAAVFDRCLTPSFAAQLREMFARITEVADSQDDRRRILDRLDGIGEGGCESGDKGSNDPGSDVRERLRLQWTLAFRLRDEYSEAVSRRFPDESRLDSSALLRAAASELRRDPSGCAPAVPGTVIVDDAQDLTPAGMEFLRALEPASRIVLVADPDEAVQTFRGASPDVLLTCAVASADGDDGDRAACGSAVGRLGAVPVGLGPVDDGRASRDDPDYRSVIASRVSLSITSDEDGLGPLPRRPWKLPDLHGSLSGAVVPKDDPLLARGRSGVSGLLYRSPAQETDDVVRQIADAHLAGMPWSEMAVIAHDNSTVHAFGERLRTLGIPVRYSSVTRSFATDPLVQGLLSLLRLARMRNGTYDFGDDPSVDEASQVPLPVQRDRAIMAELETYLSSPLCEVPPETVAAAGDMHHADGRSPGDPAIVRSWPRRPLRLSAVRSALASVVAMATALGGVDDVSHDATDAEPSARGLRSLAQAWGTSTSHGAGGLGADGDGDADSLSMTATGVVRPVPDRSVAWLSGLLVRHLPSRGTVSGARPGDSDDSDGAADPLASLAREVLEAADRIAGRSPDIAAFDDALRTVADVAADLRVVGGDDPASALWSAWDRSGVADRWQSLAIGLGPESDLANDRLDVAVRLFDYASQGGDFHTLDEFVGQVSGMDVIADSLSRTHPVLDAVTLTTPAGAVGESWKRVWMPRLQEGIWPNLAPRNTMFGADELAGLALRGSVGTGHRRGPAPQGLPSLDERDREVLRGEQRSLLVAITRAREDLILSASWNDDEIPSDFLSVYAPELFPRRQSRQAARFVDVGSRAAVPSTPHGLVVAARRELTRLVAAWWDSHDGQGSGDAEETASVSGAATPPVHLLSDPVHALVTLSRAGYERADPRFWSFLHPRGGENGVETADESTDGWQENRASRPAAAGSASAAARTSAGPLVPLSPSTVDAIWSCPVCALLERQMSGPTPSGVAMSFGTIIHRVAQVASERGLDRPDASLHGPDGGGLPTDDANGRIRALTGELKGIYGEVRGPLDAADGVGDIFRVRGRERGVTDILRDISAYFVKANLPDYATGKANPRMGVLRDVSCELRVPSRFGIRDVLDAYNAVPGADPVGFDDMVRILDVLAGGFPHDFRPDLRILLTSRIDRLELRSDDEGDFCRIVDFKTGGRGHSGPECFGDLQLVCYQLALRFADATPDEGILGFHPPVSAAALFDVSVHDAPGYFFYAENAAQPPIFDGDHLNAGLYRPRSHARDLWTLFPDFPVLGDRPDAVSAGAWSRLLRERDEGRLTFWALSMIARVFYAAAVTTTDLVPPHPVVDGAHRRYCRYAGVCPRCSEGIETVMGRERS